MARSKKDNPSSSEEEAASGRRNRRQALVLGGAAAAAAAVAAFRMDGGKKAEAHGKTHKTSNTADPAIHGDNTADGPGVEGTSQSGAGVVGNSQNLQGVRGEGELGVFGLGESDIGVFGFASGGDGTGGFSPSSVGGRFASGSGIGLRGVSPGDAKPAVEAASGVIGGPSFEPVPDGGLALDVIGKARFSTAGAGVVPAGAEAASVADSAVTAQSHVTVTLTGDPGNASAVVQWVERQPGSGFVVHLRVSVSSETPFTYLIVEPGS